MVFSGPYTELISLLNVHPIKNLLLMKKMEIPFSHSFGYLIKMKK
jgi:hypothetical protein